MTGIAQRKAQWEQQAREDERRLIVDWLRGMAARLTKQQRDCLLANADIIEANNFKRKEQ